MTRSLNRLQAIVLGLVVLTGVALGGWAVIKIGGRQRLFAETYELRAGFSSANGLERGTPVRVRGIDAGEVIGVELPDNPRGKVFLRLRLDRKFQPLIPTDSQATVVSEGMLGGRIVNIEPGKSNDRLQNGDEVATFEGQELAQIMQEASKTLQEIRDSNGTLAKLVKTDEAHKEVVQLVKDTQKMVKQGQETFEKTQDALRRGEETLNTVKQDAEAIKKLPILRGYVEDSTALLYRPHMNRDRRVYYSGHIFEMGRAVFSEAGYEHLNALAVWLATNKTSNSEVVVVAYAGASDLSDAAAQTLTTRQTEAVVAYLKDNFKVHRTGWFSSRKITALGMGRNSPPVAEKEPHSPDRIEVVVFTP